MHLCNKTKIGEFLWITQTSTELSQISTCIYLPIPQNSVKKRPLLPCFLHPCTAMKTLLAPRLFKHKRPYAETGPLHHHPLILHQIKLRLPGHSASLRQHSPQVEEKHTAVMALLRILPMIAAVIIFGLADSAFATNAPDYLVQGRVYCDTCRAGFETNVTEYIKGAKVRLECKHFGTGNVERAVDGVTDETGTYKIELKDSHVEDICEVVLIKSPLANCGEIQALRDRARVVLTRNVGICDNLRLANPLGYLKDVPLPICGELLKQFDLADDDE